MSIINPRKKDIEHRGQEKKVGFKDRLASVLSLIFVHNIGYKLLALATAVASWFLVTWLS